MTADIIFGLVLVGVIIYAAAYTAWQWWTGELGGERDE